MKEQGFFEFQTPILTASSPEGARDFLVPSRMHPGKFYALPQAPQQFKQLIMVSGFDRYFQIAPCFRDEDARADRSPGEFYQLDIEMSFVTQEDVFDAVEPVLRGVFEEFADGKPVTPEISAHRLCRGACAMYGTDKPDLRNPIKMQDVTEHFRGSGFKVFAGMIAADPKVEVWAIPAPTRRQPRVLRSHERLGARARASRALAISSGAKARRAARGRSRKTSAPERTTAIRDQLGLESRRCRVLRRRQAEGFRQIRRTRAQQSRRGARASSPRTVSSSAGSSTSRCSSGTRKRRRSTSPTTRSRCRTWTSTNSLSSMPRTRRKLLALNAIQYDIVCNGIELSSGAIRNHRPDVMKKAFAIAGYGEDVLEAEVRRHAARAFATARRRTAASRPASTAS